jgi:hypothetical protein
VSGTLPDQSPDVVAESLGRPLQDFQINVGYGMAALTTENKRDA